MNLNKQNLISKIIYRAQYRGSKEMDIFLSSFVNSIIESLSFEELIDLDNLVNKNDEDIIKIVNKNKEQENFNNNKIIKFLIKFKNKN